MSISQYGFSLPFRFPVAFTRAAFAPDNAVLVDAIARGESRPSRVLAVVDDGVARAIPGVVDDLARYVSVHAGRLTLAAPPVVVAGGEGAKQGLDAALDVVAHVNALGIDRQSYVLAVGGGAVLDMASFAAAIAHRGVRTVRMPTTTLAQGDSGFAVKNGVNYFGKKNFLGTFVPPWAVVNDSDFLETLSARDRRCGIAEAVKVALLKDRAFFEWLEANARTIEGGDWPAINQAVRRSAELHLTHICGNGDPFELGSARPLDFGHWAAHKLEVLSEHAVKHGEAVAIGMALDVRYSVRAGYLPAGEAGRIFGTLQALGFDLDHPALSARSETGALTVIDGLQEFREHLGGELHVTLLSGIGQGFEVHELDPALVEAALADLRTPLSA